jgi:hypothetical protein
LAQVNNAMAVYGGRLRSFNRRGVCGWIEVHDVETGRTRAGRGAN